MSLNKAADDLKVLLKRISPLFNVVAELERLGSLDNAAKEAEERKTLAYASASAADKAAQLKKDELQKMLDQLMIAEKKAEQLVKNAEIKAEAVLADAKAKIFAMKIEQEEKSRSEMQAMLALKEDMKKVELEIAAKQSQVFKLEAHLKEMKTKVASLV